MKITNTKAELAETVERLKRTHFAENDYKDCCEKIINGEYTTCKQVEAHPVK